jgi:hypothetical protein
MIELGERGLNIASYKRGTRRTGFLGLGGEEGVLIPDNNAEARSMLYVRSILFQRYSDEFDYSRFPKVKYELGGAREFHGSIGQIATFVNACEAKGIKQTGTI